MSATIRSIRQIRRATRQMRWGALLQQKAMIQGHECNPYLVAGAMMVALPTG